MFRKINSRLNQSKIVTKEEKKLKINKFILKNSYITILHKFLVNQHLLFLQPMNYSSRLHTICLITGRSRSVHKNYKIARTLFKKLALQGHLPGVVKHS